MPLSKSNSTTVPVTTTTTTDTQADPPRKGIQHHARQAWTSIKKGWARYRKWHDKKNHAVPGCNGPRCRLIRRWEWQAQQRAAGVKMDPPGAWRK